MRSWILPLASFLLAAALVTGCSDDETSPAPGIFSVSLSGLPVLPESLYYEAFARFTPALAHELDAVSFGAFKVDKDGNLLSLSGGPANFGLVDASDLSPVDIVITVRTPDDTTIGAPLLGGEVSGDDDEGRATLSTTYHDAVDADLTTAAGTCILATPSTSAIEADSTQGVWFVNNTNERLPSLSLPKLGEHWLYGAWVFNEGDTVAIGEFAEADSADSDGEGPAAGPDQGFNAPGSDFVVLPRNLADGESTVFVTIQPEEHADPGPGLGEVVPFPLRILELAIPFGVASDSSMILVRPTAPLPTGVITFTR